MALVQLAAVRHSGGDSPIAADAIRELCRAASGADAAVRAAVAGMPAGGQFGSAAASAVAVRLECLEAALCVALSAKMAVDTQLAPLTHSATQLAVTVLQCTALQVHSLHDSIFHVSAAWLLLGLAVAAPTSTHQQAATLLLECRAYSSASLLCCFAAGTRCCPARSSAPVHHTCVLRRQPANGCIASHGNCISPRRGTLCVRIMSGQG